MQKSVTFKNKNWEVAAHLYVPDNFNENEKYSAIIFVHPGSSVKVRKLIHLTPFRQSTKMQTSKTLQQIYFW
ncbi:hypothetical protein [Pedobacter jejuensis]|uniref:Uncharacterized protein n=1 Tax=Pedobacter jejuensis TaxID=1268550 RepID=A0A3N0BQ35_9SPHI|nr:hypothetical protein [Pedobacter jejuensis]RNL51174.1 hypothetical protein D7004_15760 [Pedobacter jejuensis]